jgi:3-phosphoshikimate 1-carboxyvinyltransferase
LVLDPGGDHRMAFAFALLGLAVEGVRVSAPGCVAKSWPGFWSDLETLGARIVST